MRAYLDRWALAALDYGLESSNLNQPHPSPRLSTGQARQADWDFDELSAEWNRRVSAEQQD